MFRQIYEVCDFIYRWQAAVLPVAGVLSCVFSQISSGTLDNTLFERFKSSFGKDTPPEEAEGPQSQPATGLDRLSRRARNTKRNKAGLCDQLKLPSAYHGKKSPATKIVCFSFLRRAGG